jgi:hypothetical protein
MSEKKKFLLRIDDKIYGALEKWSADELRSINSQIEFLLKDALKRSNRLPNALDNSTVSKNEEDSPK